MLKLICCPKEPQEKRQRRVLRTNTMEVIFDNFKLFVIGQMFAHDGPNYTNCRWFPKQIPNLHHQ